MYINTNNSSDIIISIIIGLVFGILLGNLFFDKRIYHGPDSNIIIKEIYSDLDGKQYKWVPKICICPISTIKTFNKIS